MVKKSKDYDLSLLKDLINSYCISGDEADVRKLIIKHIKPYCKEYWVDKLGNLIVHKKGIRPRIMLAAHMDEIGLMIKKIDSNGRIYCAEIGSFEIMTLIGQRVYIKTKKGYINGVLTTNEVSDDIEVAKIPLIDEVFVDTGLGYTELRAKGVEIGQYASLGRKFHTLGNENLISGKSLDDRIGCYVLVEVIKRLKNIKNEIYFVFTVQEEIGLYGAKTSAYEIDPDWGIAVDVTGADDMGNSPTKIIGNGPFITIKDYEMLANKCLNDWIKGAAKKMNINLQLEVTDIGSTDALNITISRGGVPAAVIGVPVRNLHTTMSICHKHDIVDTIELLLELLKSPPKVCLD